MEQNEISYWLAWNRVSGIGPARFYKLLEEFGSMEDAWKARFERVQPIVGEKAAVAWRDAVKDSDLGVELHKLEVNHFQVYCFTDPEYPALLKKISDPPPVLYCWGDLQYGDDVAVAIVGTRNPSPVGAHHAETLAMELSGQGLTIVSGMARGIDSEAHRGALKAGGRTIAVLGCGLNVCYPPENQSLMEEVAGHGAVVTEFPLGTEPLSRNFPARNRIISGLSLGVVVVEATDDSGSLITAGFALEQGRDIFAVPGSIGHEGSKGPHKLIRQGAKLVETSRDILDDLAIPYLAMEEMSTARVELLNETESGIYRCLTREPLHIDQITRASKLGSAQVNSVLFQLELRGLVKSFPGQLYLKVK